jgi:hypothetical protein
MTALTTDAQQEHSTAAHADARLFEFCDTSLDTNLFATQTYQNTDNK